MSTRKSLTWSFATQGGQFILQFAASVIIARLLTPAELGVFALAMAVNALLYTVRDFGIGAYLIREEHLDADKIRTAFGLWLLLAWPAGMALFLLRAPIAAFVGAPEAADVISLLALTFFITPFGQPTYALLSREMRFDAIHHVSMFSSLAGTATSITLAYLGYSYMSLAWGILVTAAVTTAHLYFYHPDHIRMLPSLKHWRDVMHFGGYMTATSVVSTLGAEGPKFMLGNLINPAAVAIIDKASQIPNMIRQGLMQPIGRVMIPSLSRDVRENRNIDSTIEKLVLMTTSILWPLMLAIGIVATPLIVFIFGENWRHTGEILPYILIAHATSTLLPPIHQILQPHGAVERIFKFSSMMFVSNLVFAIIGALHSIEMFAMLRIIHVLIATILTYFGTRKYWNPPFSLLARTYLKSLTVTIMTCAPFIVGVSVIEEDLGFSQIAMLFGSLPFAWTVAILASNHPLSIELKSAYMAFTASRKK